MMNIFIQMLADLRAHQTVCRELLALAERESQALRQAGSVHSIPSDGILCTDPASILEIHQARKPLLPRLSDSLEKVRQHRIQWQRLTVSERSAQPEIGFLVRQAQDLILRVLLLDRENEQALLRRGLIPPREIPAAQQQRPHFVAGLYRRHAA